MIFINRNKVKKPDVFDNSAKEHKDAHEHYVTKKNDKAFDHKIFKHSDVKDALYKLFNGKCAYCESKVTKTSPIDKEHFRPKTKIKNRETGDSQRGYYWLAAEWENLLSACSNCNRTGTYENELKEEFVSGKLDYFPLNDESKRAKYNEDLKEEEKVRLLINPCIDKPEEIIDYNSDGEIVPKPNIDSYNKEKVETSVEIFGLHRSDLHKDRREKWQDVTIQLVRIKEAYEDYLGDPKTKYLERLKREFQILKDQKSIDREHLGVARFVIRQELSELKSMLLVLNEK